LSGIEVATRFFDALKRGLPARWKRPRACINPHHLASPRFALEALARAAEWRVQQRNKRDPWSEQAGRGFDCARPRGVPPARTEPGRGP